MRPAALRSVRRATVLPGTRLAPSDLCIFCAHSPRSYRARPSSRSIHTSASTRQDAPPRSFGDDRSLRTFYDFFREALPAGPPPYGPFKVDVKALRNEFLRVQGMTHPDRHPPEQKARAEALSAQVNEAYRTLQDPLLRTQYLLSLKGIDVAEDEAAKVEDKELLMTVLDTREVIEDAQDRSELKFVKERNDKNMRETLDDLEEAFEKDDMTVAKREAVRLRYWVNIKQSIDDWEPGKPVVLQH